MERQRTESKKVIYWLELEGNRYYVGETDNINSILAWHLKGTREYTKKFKPIRIAGFTDKKDMFDELVTTLKLMKVHGINNVRGSVYVQIQLSQAQIDDINEKIWGASGCCHRCGSREHWASDCSALKCSRCGRTTHSESSCFAGAKLDGTPLPCSRCGRSGHSMENCFAKWHVNNTPLFVYDTIGWVRSKFNPSPKKYSS
jgi:predicted GIY-YIG superfamily endonuclease